MQQCRINDCITDEYGSYMQLMIVKLTHGVQMDLPKTHTTDRHSQRKKCKRAIKTCIKCKFNSNAFFGSGSTVSFTAQNLRAKLRAQRTDITFNITSIHETNDLKAENVPFKIKRLH